jgi:hypothetical protein
LAESRLVKECGNKLLTGASDTNPSTLPNSRHQPFYSTQLAPPHMTMSSISSFGRAAILSMPTNTCRSCQQIRLGAITQQRDFRWKAKPSPETEFAPLDRKIKSKGWPMTPQEDEKYVVATEGKGLEHVGGDKWQEKQFDDKPKYKG